MIFIGPLVRGEMALQRRVNLSCRPRKDAELPGLEKVENLIWAQLA